MKLTNTKVKFGSGAQTINMYVQDTGSELPESKKNCSPPPE